MAKATIEIRCAECGAIFTHSKTCYNREQANSYEEWAKDNITICPECFKAQKAAEKLSKILAWLGNEELPALTGSEKQIAWTEKIRLEKLDYLKTIIPSTEKNQKLLSEILSKATESRFWIDNRDLCGRVEICNALTQLVKQ